MGRAYGRRVELLIETGGTGRLVTDLRMSFEVRMTRSSSPQRARVAVYNPADATLRAVREDGARVTVRAGYGDAIGTVCVGAVIPNGVNIKRESADRILVVEVSDGWRELRDGFVNITLAGETTAKQVIDEVLRRLTVGRGRIVYPDKIWRRGFTASDTARNVLDIVARSTGSEWRILDGVLHFYPRGEAIDSVRPLISTGTLSPGSLIGDATVKDSPEGVPEVQVRSLLLPTLRPGRKFRVATASGIGDGDYIAQDVVHTGDSWQGPFYTEIVGRRE